METRQHGFTLWELMMTLLVAGILLGVGVPNVREFQRNGAMTAAANDFVTGVLMARTEAVKRQAPVTICLSDNPTDPNPTCAPDAVADSTRGFIVWVDENDNFDANGARILTDGSDGDAVVDMGELVLMQSAAPGGTIRISANCGHVSFAPTGFTRAVPGECVANPRSLLFCDDRGRRLAAGSLSSARIVRVDLPGRGQVLQELAAITADIAGPLAGVAPTCP
jgi:type IV fimbrial biogenesis protein FimT